MAIIYALQTYCISCVFVHLLSHSSILVLIIMDYINSFSKSLPIHHAVQLIQPFSYKLTDMYKRSSRNELMFVGAATFFTLYNISYHFKTKQHKLNLPPSVPFALPFFGHGLYLMCMPSKFLDWCHGKYGEVYTVNMFGKTITIAGGKSAEEALSAETSEMSLDHGILRGKSFPLFLKKINR